MKKSYFYLKLNIQMHKTMLSAGIVSAITSVLPIAINSVPFIFYSKQVQAQSVIPAGDTTGTVVTPNGNQFNITGGEFSQDGSNLFHSFKEFGLSENQIANFLSNPGIQNIFGRVIGGNPSIINGLIQLTGGNSNLFLMNPSGIVFGNNASLNVPGDFTATTANGIGFGNNWLNAFGDNDYAILTGKPWGFAFTMSQPGAIINAGNLKVTNGNLTLLGGTVTSLGRLEATSGNITVSSVEGENLIRLSQPGSLLSLEIQPISTAKNLPQPWNFAIASLPEMLTGGNGSHVTELIRNSNGDVELKGSSLTVKPGDTTVKTLNAENALISASGNLTFGESQLQTTENLTLLAKDTVRVRDSKANPFIAVAGGNFYIQGDKGIDILALNHLDKTPFVSGGDLSLVSDGIISGDAHFASGGKFSILNLQGEGGNFISLYDPIISSEEDVSFGSYTGAALKIESKGNITVNGDIEITSLDSDICQSTCSADAQILANEAALILRAGVSELEEPAFNYPSEFGNPPISFNGTSFNSSGTTSSPANVTVNGDIITSFDVSTERVGRVIITAPGDINTQNIFTDYSSVEFFLNNLFGGEVNLKAGGNISTIDINSSVNLNAGDFVAGGNINLEAGGNIIVKDGISSGANTFEQSSQISGGEINLKAGGNIVVQDAITSQVFVGGANDISAGKINIDSGGDIFVAEIESSVDVNGLSLFIPLSNNAFGGEVNLKAVGDIIMGPISSSVDLFATSDNGIAGNVNLATDGNIFVQDIEALVRVYSPFSNNVVAGNVNINSGENIVFGSVNTSNFNGTSSFDEENSSVGRGGDVKVIADNGTVRGGLFLSEDILEEEDFVRELELPEWLKLPEGLEITTEELKLIELNLPNTISTVGEDSSGTVEISHDGTIENIPFIVGDANINGTAGAINAGDNVILPTTEYPNAGTVNQGNISINFNNTAPDITVNSDLNISSANQPITFTLTDINQNISDANNDITSVQINQISDGGSLKINGIPATSGNIITSTDTLEYTPPANTTGEINAFTIVANDKISVSTPTAINVKIGDTQPVPQEPNEPLLPAPPQSQPPLLLKPDTTSKIVNRLEIDTMMGKVENYFTNSFKGHLGNAIAVDLVGLQEAREILNEVEKASGIRPALVYAMFVPPGLSSQANNTTTNLKNDSDILEILIITAKGKPIRKQIRDATRADLLKVVRKFQREVSNPRKSHTKTYLQPSQQLYQWLIAPVQKELQIKGIQNLTFITDVGLRSIPFAALHNGNSFLVEQYSIGLMPSLSLTNTKYTDIKQAQVLAMGASKFNQQNPLPAVPLEINHISKQWQGKSFLNENFTAQNLKSQRSEQPFGIIHLATHAEFRPGKLENSYIQLSNQKLRLNEVRKMGWNDPPVELLTLSACRTALGDREAELGFAGLAVQTGVKSALGSLWYVSDEGTLGLMTQFYQQLKQTPIKAEALRQTQIAMIKGQVILEKGILQLPQSTNIIPLPSLAGKSRKLLHPYYWSPFTLIGSPW